MAAAAEGPPKAKAKMAAAAEGPPKATPKAKAKATAKAKAAAEEPPAVPAAKATTGLRAKAKAEAQAIAKAEATAEATAEAPDEDEAEVAHDIEAWGDKPELVYCDCCKQHVHYRRCRLISKKRGAWRCGYCSTKCSELRRIFKTWPTTEFAALAEDSQPSIAAARK